MGKFFKSYLFPFFILLLILAILPLIILQVKLAQRYLSKASYIKANLVIDAQQLLGNSEGVFTNLAQGGEVNLDGTPVGFGEISRELSLLKPGFIRIDHVYDLYTKVENTEQGIKIDFTKLDKAIKEILATGAKLFVSLSYMPSSLAKNGEITGPPMNWSLWQELVRKTVEHISGQNDWNLTEVYYEVWNEPDLFGNWRTWGERDYRMLYKYAVLGAISAREVNNFKIGGPGITHPMRNWFIELAEFIEKENLRIDFISWHRYTQNPDELSPELDLVNNWIGYYPHFVQAEKIISETGPTAENNQIYDTYEGALYTLNAATYWANKVNKIFNFEIKDGPSPMGKQYWGRWGIFTNEQYGQVAKPRYQALLFLQNIQGNYVKFEGNGTYTRAIATKNKERYNLLIVNDSTLVTSYSQPTGDEIIPIVWKNLENGTYKYTIKEFGTGEEVVSQENITSNFLSKALQVSPNKAYLITMEKIGELANFKLGRQSGSDLALVFDKMVPQLSYPVNNEMEKQGTVEFWANFNLPDASLEEENFLQIPLNEGKILLAKKRMSSNNFSSEIIFGIFEREKPLFFISSTLATWKRDEWHHLAFTWNQTRDNLLNLKVYFDGNLLKETNINYNLQISVGQKITIGRFNGVIDELRISSVANIPTSYYLSTLSLEPNTLILRHFNGKIEE